MSSILVQWGENVGVLDYEPSWTVETFRDHYYYVYEELFLGVNINQPRGYFKWDNKMLRNQMLMSNYAFNDESILVFCDEATERIEVKMNIGGRAKLFIFHFDESTTVEDLKYMLISSAYLSISTDQIMLSNGGMELKDNTFTLMDYDVQPSSLLQAKEVPEKHYPKLRHDVHTIRFNGEPLRNFPNGLPLGDLIIEYTCSEEPGSKSLADTLSVFLREAASPRILDMEEVSCIVSEKECTKKFRVSSLKPGVLYRLKITSSCVKYGVKDREILLDFTMLKEYGAIHFQWNETFLSWTNCPRPKDIPIVHSLLQLIRKKVLSLKRTMWATTIRAIETSLRNIRKLQVRYTNSLAVVLKEINYDINDEDAMQEELDLEHYLQGNDIYVRIFGIPVKQNPPSVVEAFKEPQAVEQVDTISEVQPEDEAAKMSEELQAVAQVDTISEVQPVDEAAKMSEELQAVAQVDTISEVQPEDEAAGTSEGVEVKERELENSLLGDMPLNNVTDEEQEAFVDSCDEINVSITGDDEHEVAKSTDIVDNTNPVEENVIIGSINDIEICEELVPCVGAQTNNYGEDRCVNSSLPSVFNLDSCPDEDTESCTNARNNEENSEVVEDSADQGFMASLNEPENSLATSVVHNVEGNLSRQVSDGTDSMVEFMDDDFLVLMAVDPMDQSILIAEENQHVDIVCDK